MDTIQHANDAFGSVLTQALQLEAKDQERLADLMNRVARRNETVDPPAVVGESQSDASSEEVSLEQWLQTLSELTPWQRLQLIDDAIENTEAGTTNGAELEKARRELLNEHPALNVRLAIQRSAAEHPGRVVIGVIGLLLAIGTLGHGLFRLVF